MANLNQICIDGDCSEVKEYTGGTGISVAPDGTISNTAPGINYTAGDNITIQSNEISAPNVYNKTEVDELLSGISSIRMEVVDSLPATGESNVIYLLDDGQGNYEQWVYTQTDGWIDLGGEEIDLSNYVTVDDLAAALANKQDKLTAGTNVQISNGVISATDTKYTGTSPITVSGTAISHAASGVTAGTKGTNNTTALTPAFGGTFNVIGLAVNATGHITSANSHTVKMPNSAATESAAGLMSAADKTKLNKINNTYIKRVDHRGVNLTTSGRDGAFTVTFSATPPEGYTFVGWLFPIVDDVGTTSALNNEYVAAHNTWWANTAHTSISALVWVHKNVNTKFSLHANALYVRTL